MAKFCGEVGFETTIETAPGVFVEEIHRKRYRGDILRNSRRLQSGEHVNDDVVISNQISILADPYLFQNFHTIRLVNFFGQDYKVTDIEVNYPRLTMTLGGLYNGQKS